MRVKVGLGLLLLLLSFNFLNAKSLFNDHLVSPKAADVIEKIGSEFRDKTSINEYLITTNDKIPRGVSVYDYIKKYSISKPYVGIVFAPNSKRIHVVSSDKELLKKLDKGKILDYAIKVIASKDSNSLQSKFDVGLVQAFSELADQVANTKGIKLKNTIKAGGRWVLKIVNTLIIVGSLIVIWIYFIAPYFRKKRK
jgi:hypothetical protein